MNVSGLWYGTGHETRLQVVKHRRLTHLTSPNALSEISSVFELLVECNLNFKSSNGNLHSPFPFSPPSPLLPPLASSPKSASTSSSATAKHFSNTPLNARNAPPPTAPPAKSTTTLRGLREGFPFSINFTMTSGERK
ncbi:uncharacterized protein STEHIDRAFT_121096 [Stereum hirsutum FP-91666 SS1]|uniref:uncharacterized protein n=1 Tax=Stereum hirsutum (strain FP-91666) TaxID=721885 RepID=UPI000440B8C3|nr:uncharacterized protein STEHIDRAFT_121096 [Stereum hirsutum FP-91666 SS1]EIM87475.1 hypothetical protein STEHIDRAFT_121096 [Stereum hirsutum FP-91666 SS1]